MFLALNLYLDKNANNEYIMCCASACLGIQPFLADKAYDANKHALAILDNSGVAELLPLKNLIEKTAS